jgi:transcriptional regulator with XRE-family HTH domain
MSEDTLESAKKRISERLDAVISDTVSYVSRYRLRDFSDAVGIEEGVLREYLSGRITPSLEDLIKICAFSNRKLDYFFKQELEDIPSHAIFASPLTGGGAKVPVGFSNLVMENGIPRDAEWTYYVAKRDMGFGIVEGDYVFNFTTHDPFISLRMGSLYLMGSPNELEMDIKQCARIGGGKAAFLSFGKDANFGNVISFPLLGRNARISRSSLLKVGISYFGEIRSKTSMTLLSGLDVAPWASLVSNGSSYEI